MFASKKATIKALNDALDKAAAENRILASRLDSAWRAARQNRTVAVTWRERYDTFDKAVATLQHETAEALDDYDKAVETACADGVEAAHLALTLEDVWAHIHDHNQAELGACYDYIQALEEALLGPAGQ